MAGRYEWRTGIRPGAVDGSRQVVLTGASLAAATAWRGDVALRQQVDSVRPSASAVPQATGFSFDPAHKYVTFGDRCRRRRTRTPRVLAAPPFAVLP